MEWVGTHVAYVSDLVARYVADYINKQDKELKVTPAMECCHSAAPILFSLYSIAHHLTFLLNPKQVKNHMRVFVNALIHNPSFDAQVTRPLISDVTVI